MGKFIDLTGKTYGRLTVIEYIGKSKWLCQCECGNVKVVRSDNLKKGVVVSCGCYNRERMKEQWQNNNFRQLHTNRMKQLNEEQWQNNNFRQMKIEKTKQQWQDEEMKWRMNYKGGITLISQHLRNLQILTQWRKDTYIRENSKCQLTGKHVHGGNSDVHHLKAFNTIVQEAHDLHEIEIKEIVADYTEQELKLLEDYVTSCHTDTTNAVLLSDEVHDLFHHEYGYGDNTPEQFEEFKERYMAGEFNNSDSNNNKVA